MSGPIVQHDTDSEEMPLVNQGEQLEIMELARAKQMLDESLLPQLEQRLKLCSDNIDHLLCSLQGSLQATSTVSLDIGKLMAGSIEDVNVAVAGAVQAMNQLLTRVQELNEEMKPVEEIAAQVKDISTTLTLLENAVAKLQKERRKKKKS